MLLINSEGMVFNVPDHLLAGSQVSDWLSNQEDINKLFFSLRETVMKMAEFRDDFQNDAELGVCCACAGGGQAINYAKYVR